MGIRGPIRADSAPARAESISISAVTGNSAVPAANGENPETTCRLITTKKKTPASAAYTTNVTRLVALNVPERNTSSGSIGCLDRASLTTNPTIPVAPMTSAPRTKVSPGPRSGQAVKAYVTPPSPTAHSTAPSRSSCLAASGSADSGTCLSATRTTTAASGRLMRKIRRQVDTSTIQPPRNGPTAPATPPSPDHAPIAFIRSPGANDACRIASAPGVSSAPPTPWIARAATRVLTFGARPHSSEPSANHATPTTKIRRRPNRSPREPPSRMKAARVSVYALTVHCRPAASASSASPIRGRAMLTTVPSMNANAEPSTVARSTQRPAGSPYRTSRAAAGPVDAGVIDVSPLQRLSLEPGEGAVRDLPPAVVERE